MPNKSCDDILFRNQKSEVKEMYHNINIIAYNMFINYGMKKFKHQIGCQYKPLLELKYIQVIGKRKHLISIPQYRI